MSVEDITNIDEFINGIYRELSIARPPRTSLPNTSTYRSQSVHSSPIESSSSGPTSSIYQSQGVHSPTYCSARTNSFSTISLTDESCSVVSPPTRRNLDADIERINRMCDNVEQNLRSVGVFIDNSGGRINSQDVLKASHSISNINLNSPLVDTTRSPTNTLQNPEISVIHIEHTPEISREPHVTHRINPNNDDDVILVSSSIPVVDLCTPTEYRAAPRARSINQRQLNRRRLPDHVDHDIELCCSGPTPSRRRRTEPILRNIEEPCNTSISESQKSKGDSDLTPLKCPICMESCLQREPTSTHCGHIFCKTCIKNCIRLSHKCPMCNAKISRSKIFRIYL